MRQTDTAKHTYIRRDGDTVVLKPRGNLTGGPETDELERLIEELDKELVGHLVINLASVQLLNSLAVSRLVHAHLRFTKRSARVVLCNLESRVQNIFDTTRLGQVFHIAANEDAAVSLGRKAE